MKEFGSLYGSGGGTRTGDDRDGNSGGSSGLYDGAAAGR